MLELSSTFRIHRYPTALIDRVMLADGRSVLVRPVLPQDGELHRRFVRELSPASRYRRFHFALSELPDSTLDYLTKVDYASHLALLGEAFDERGDEVQVAEARYVRRTDADEADVADFALAVADRWQGLGLGRQMLAALVHGARRGGVRRLEGSVLADNEPMCSLLRRHGWRLRIDPDDGRLLVARLELAAVPVPAIASAIAPAIAPALEVAPC